MPAKSSQHDLHQRLRLLTERPWREAETEKETIVPVWMELGCRALPLPVANVVLCHLLRRIVRKHPKPFDRMAPYASTLFLIEPTDLPIQFHIQLNSPAPVICRRRSAICAWDARITGPLAILLATVHGTLDGDALFFSREITIEGNTDAILAMRNAIDAAEIDLPHELTDLFGPLSPVARRLAKNMQPVAERVFSTAAHLQRVRTT